MLSIKSMVDFNHVCSKASIDDTNIGDRDLLCYFNWSLDSTLDSIYINIHVSIIVIKHIINKQSTLK